MIRRDYLLQMIQNFIQALSRISALKSGQRWEEATVAADEEFNRLVGAGAPAVVQLSETELLARLVRGEPTQIVHYKTLLLTTLLKEAGDLAATQNQPAESRAYYLKGLHLLLDVLADNEVADCPHFVPKVELFVEALLDAPLPGLTQARLMQHYERSGQFAKAEDALFALLDEQPANVEALDFGITFYERLRHQNDPALADGNLPRAELEASAAELLRRKATLAAR
jgi:hypothetical protein